MKLKESQDSFLFWWKWKDQEMLDHVNYNKSMTSTCQDFLSSYGCQPIPAYCLSPINSTRAYDLRRTIDSFFFNTCIKAKAHGSDLSL